MWKGGEIMGSITYRNCKKLIEAGRTEGMQEKLDVFLLANRITTDEYNELVSLLKEV